MEKNILEKKIIDGKPVVVESRHSVLTKEKITAELMNVENEKDWVLRELDMLKERYKEILAKEQFYETELANLQVEETKEENIEDLFDIK